MPIPTTAKIMWKASDIAICERAARRSDMARKVCAFALPRARRYRAGQIVRRRPADPAELRDPMSRAPRAPLAILLIAAASAGGAQEVARSRAVRAAAVTGTIYDSIARAPLSRAVVYLAGTSHTGSTDRTGRFQLDGVPAGRYQVAFTHPVLDTLGIAAPERSIEVRDGGIAKADLYVPSMWSMVKRLCPAGMPREASGL